MSKHATNQLNESSLLFHVRLTILDWMAFVSRLAPVKNKFLKSDKHIFYRRSLKKMWSVCAVIPSEYYSINIFI